MIKYNYNVSLLFSSFCLLVLPIPSFAAGIDAGNLSLCWGIPFVAILLSVALGPILFSKIWHHHFGKIMLFWIVTLLTPFMWQFGLEQSVALIAHALLLEYLPFILLLLALFTVSGGILVKGDVRASTRTNVILLLIGTILASIMGTTGAAMLLIRPLLRFNRHRTHKVHLVIFFIFLVANIGGGLTPLGDPPLFLGFLEGVSFSWTLYHMFLPVALATLLLLVLFYKVDCYYLRRETALPERPKNAKSYFEIKGRLNILLLLGIVGSVVLSGVWKPEQTYVVLGQTLKLQELIASGLMLLITVLSLYFTPKERYQENEFSWEPMQEVAKLFIAIFITIGPVILILRAGQQGALQGIIHLVSDQQGAPINSIYFWITGLLSGFLDNAPTYLVFFNLASGNANLLMTTLKETLLAISMGSVFMGALTYIGNAPNFMVRSIAIQNGVKMPSFIGYMKWSILILIPLFLLFTALFFY